MIETHAHIYMEQFRDDLPETLERAQKAGIRKILMPNIDSTSVEAMLSVEESYPELCYSMMGLHPCSVNASFEKELYLVEQWLGKRSFLAVGEIGTDLYWDKTYFEQQKAAMQAQCEMALRYQLPIAIHCRESINETIAIVRPFAARGLTGVFHCFTGDVNQAREISEMGFYLGLGGVLTFKNAGLDKVIAEIGLEQVILETDSPYLTPTPHRGKRNEPAYIRLVAEKLVAILPDTSFADVVATTTANANSLFNLKP